MRSVFEKDLQLATKFCNIKEAFSFNRNVAVSGFIFEAHTSSCSRPLGYILL